VAPISSIKEHTKKYPTDVWITPKESGLARDSRVLLSQIRTVDKDERLLNKIGKLSPKKMIEVDQAIRISLALD
jgi:mRNA interferase MazF